MPRCLLLGRGEVVVKLCSWGVGGWGRRGGGSEAGVARAGAAEATSEARRRRRRREAEAAEAEVVGGAAGAGAAEAASRAWGSVATSGDSSLAARPRLTAKPRAIRIIGASLG